MRRIKIFEKKCATCKHSALVDGWGDLKCMVKKTLVLSCDACESYEKRAENEEIGEAKGIEDA